MLYMKGVKNNIESLFSRFHGVLECPWCWLNLQAWKHVLWSSRIHKGLNGVGLLCWWVGPWLPNRKAQLNTFNNRRLSQIKNLSSNICCNERQVPYLSYGVNYNLIKITINRYIAMENMIIWKNENLYYLS